MGSNYEKEQGGGYEDDSQNTIEPACLFFSYILNNELGVSGSKKPLPITYCRQ